MFSHNLKSLRKGRKLSQEEMANYLGITRQGYSKYENDNSEPSYEMLIKIADFFDVTTDQLLGRESHKTKEEEIKPAIYEILNIPKDDYEALSSYQHEVLDWAVNANGLFFKNKADNVLDMIERLEVAYEVDKVMKKRKNNS